MKLLKKAGKQNDNDKSDALTPSDLETLAKSKVWVADDHIKMIKKVWLIDTICNSKFL
jgi:hypothetical protein